MTWTLNIHSLDEITRSQLIHSLPYEMVNQPTNTIRIFSKLFLVTNMYYVSPAPLQGSILNYKVKLNPLLHFDYRKEV